MSQIIARGRIYVSYYAGLRDWLDKVLSRARVGADEVRYAKWVR